MDALGLLSILSNIGVTESRKSKSFQELSELTNLGTTTLQFHLQKLVELGYLRLIRAEGIDKYYVTLDGVRKARAFEEYMRREKHFDIT